MVAKAVDFRADTLAAWQERLGGVPLSRICVNPSPGTATEEDLLEYLEHQNRNFELIDGALVEKPVAFRESSLAMTLGRIVGNFVVASDLGMMGGGDGPFRMLSGNVRLPDVSFVPWSAMPNEEAPEDAIWSVVPALAVEVLSKSNTKREIDRKIGELFDLGTRLIWVIDPPTESAVIYRSGEEPEEIGPDGVLDGGAVLPGFRLALAELFGSLKKRSG